MIPTLLLGCHLYGYDIHSSDVVLISNDTFDDMSECLQCCVTLPKCNFYTATLLQGLPEDLYWCYFYGNYTYLYADIFSYTSGRNC